MRRAVLTGMTTTNEDNRPMEAYGVKGMKSTPWRKTFKNTDALNRWLEKQDGNAEVHGTRFLEAREIVRGS